MEQKNNIRLQKLLKEGNKKIEVEARKERKSAAALERKEREKDAQRRLDTEVRHQAEETERRDLCEKMMSDASSNSSSINNSCLNVLNNFQGAAGGRDTDDDDDTYYYAYFYRFVYLFEAESYEIAR